MKKSLVITIFVIILVLLFNTLVFASNYPDLPSNVGKYYLVLHVKVDTTQGSTLVLDSNSTYLVSKPTRFYVDTSTSTGAVQLDSSYATFYKLVDNAWVKVYTIGSSDKRRVDDFNFLDSNHDILHSKTQDVFFSPPGPSLSEMVAEVNLSQMSHLAAGLMISLIGLWVIYLAFSKAWQFLLRTLRGA